jgi:signal peptidase I
MKALTLLLTVSVVGLCGCQKKNVVSSSMAPTIKPGETVVVDYSAYLASQPKRWDVVVFGPPMVTNQLWVMRVVALPGETVSVSNGVTIDGRPMSLPAHLTNVSYVVAGASAQSYVVPPRSYYVLGDNSQTANDSRFWGALPGTNIVGKVRGK